MKFITEEAVILDTEIQEEINESTGKAQKNYYIHGVFSTPDQKNRNGRIYPRAIWEGEVAKFQKYISEKTINTLGELEHPPRSEVSPLDAVIRIVELKMEDGFVKGKAKILNNNSEKTNQLKALIDEGMKIGVSSRGVGSVKNGIVESFKLITYDVVATPSDYNANLEGINESLNESIGPVEFTLDVNGRIIPLAESDCSSECHMFEKKEIQGAIMEKFKDFLDSTSKQQINEALTFDDMTNETEKLFDELLNLKKAGYVIQHNGSNGISIKNTKTGAVAKLVFDPSNKF